MLFKLEHNLHFSNIETDDLHVYASGTLKMPTKK